MIKLTTFQWTSMNFFGYFCAFGVLLPFLPMWLNYQGYSTEIISLIIASSYLFRFSGGLIFSGSVKNARQLIPLSRLLTLFSILSLLIIIGVAQQFWILLLAIWLFHTINGGAMPINETIASTWQQQVGMDYGRARLFGSIAFVVGTISTGYVVGWFGQQWIILIMIAFLILLLGGQLLSPNHAFEQPLKVSHSNLSYWALFKEKTTFRMLLAVSLIQAAHATYYTYSAIYWAENGISTENVSLLWGLSVVAEICLFFFSNRLFRTTKISSLIIFSVIMSFFRWMILANSVNMGWLIFSQLLHAFTYSVCHYAMVRYISMQAPEKIAKLQALYIGCASCILMAVFTLFAGEIFKYSSSYSFGIMAFIVLPAIFIVPKRFPVVTYDTKH